MATEEETNQNIEQVVEEAPDQNIDSYVLKVLSGPHIGAEIPLNLGTYTVGKADDCDIILKDEFIADKQLSLTLDQNSIKITDAKENTSLAGLYLEETQTDAQLFDIIGIGSTFFTLGAPDHAWPNLSVPKEVSYKKQISETAEESEENEANEDPSSPKRKIEVDQDASHLKKRYASTLNFLSSQTPKTQIGIAIGASIAFAIILIIIFYFIISDLSSGPQYTSTEEVKKTEEIIKKLGLEKQLNVTGPIEGIVIIKGYIDDQNNQKKLVDALSKAKISNQLDVYSNKKILTSVENVLKTKNLDLKVKSLGGGVILLEGVVDSRSQIQNIVKIIQADVPGIKDIQTSLTVRDDLYNSLESTLNTYNLEQLVTLFINETEITAQGSLTHDQKTRWISAKNKIKSLLPKDFTLIDKINIQKGKTSTAILKDQLWGVNLVGTPYIVFLDGTKYYIGDQIDRNLQIENINKKGIYLIYKKNKLFYDYNNKVQWIVE